MKIIYHKGLTLKQWFSKNIFEQMANVGSEAERTIIWRKKDIKYSQMAFERCLELLDLTIADPKNKPRLKELARARELWVDYIFGNNQYHQNDQMWQKYFYAFNYAARNI